MRDLGVDARLRSVFLCLEHWFMVKARTTPDLRAAIYRMRPGYRRTGDVDVDSNPTHGLAEVSPEREEWRRQRLLSI